MFAYTLPHNVQHDKEHDDTQCVCVALVCVCLSNARSRGAPHQTLLAGFTLGHLHKLTTPSPYAHQHALCLMSDLGDVVCDVVGGAY